MSELDRSLAGMWAEEHADPGAHVEPEELLAYHEGRLDDGAATRVGDHLEGCGECLETLLGLAALEPEAPRGDGAADFELAAAWKSFQERTSPPKPVPGTPPRNRLLQLAAMLLLASTLALSVWVVELRRQRDRMAQPRINVPVLYLDSTRSEGGVDGRLEIPPDGDFFLLVLAPSDPDVASYSVEIVDAGGRPVWSAQGLEMSDYGGLRIGLRRRWLGAGEYTVRLYSPEGDGQALLDEFVLEIRQGW